MPGAKTHHRSDTQVERLEVRRLLSSVLTLTATTGNNTFFLQQDPDDLHIDVWQNSPTPGIGTPTQKLLISGSASLVVNAGAGNDTLTQATALSIPVVFNASGGTNTLNINAGTYTIAGDPAATSSNLTINDSAALFFTAGAVGTGMNPIHLAALNILNTGSVLIDTPSSAADRAVLMTGSLTIASSALLDLTGNDLVVHNGNLPLLTQAVKTGYNSTGVLWQGQTGITSSLAAVDSTHQAAIGILNNNTLYNTFDNQPVVPTDILLKYTQFGDTNLDGKVDGSDYSRIDSAFLTGSTGWSNGDFNYDSLINGSDYTLIDNGFNMRGAPFNSPMLYTLKNALDVAQEQTQKTVANLGSTGLYPQYVNTDGSLSTVSNTQWTVGTWPGLLWALYQATGNPYYKTQATNFTWPLSADDNQTSDVGFRVYDAFYPLLQQEPGNTAIITDMLAAAAAKSSQFNSTVGAFEAWRPSTSGNPAANFNVLMDLIMDSQLLFWASAQTGNQTYYNQAVRNAVIEENYLVHPDGTSSQFAYFNSSNGQFVDNETYQGYSNTSTWARGEAWAIYGFAQVYSNTSRSDFLATSEKAANWYLAHLPSDNIPYWDFNAPEPTYRDTSAAAVAASGLLKLSKLIAVTDPKNSDRYRNAAGNILASLSSTTYLSNPATTENGVLLHGALNVPANPSIPDNPINFGDYYFVEAINEYLAG